MSLVYGTEKTATKTLTEELQQQTEYHADHEAPSLVVYAKPDLWEDHDGEEDAEEHVGAIVWQV